ncbi:HsdM family class I SAM-dependent methyltransferase [Shouchella clausii]|uniref:HsdM family class I SAM-dependent methyltransferase n=1 Tax=Shouchella clausii TaxID=79880 RepID=UPI0016532671|nr:N-6 DNA methylase [Shouchella clausii]
MGKADRKRWEGNVKSMEIIAKPLDKITEDDLVFLRENYTSAGGLLPNAYSGGAFFTPTHVARFMWDALRPLLPAKPRVLEPSVGAGVFLEHAPSDAKITALELDKTSAKVTSLLYPEAAVVEGDALTHDRRDYYDLVIGNPPYGVSVEFAPPFELEEWTLSKARGKRKGKSEVAFIELAIKAVKPGGYVAFVLPTGLAFANYAKKLRAYMHETCWQVATILLPGETFAATGTTIATQIMVIRKAPPNAKLIESATKKWGSNFRRSDFGDITDYAAKFLEGQTPAYFAKITDIGIDKHGKVTIPDGEESQLDALLEDFTDGGLVRENLYPHVPSWHDIDKGNDAFFFSHGNGMCDGIRDAEYTYSDGPLRWQELTLGAGEEIDGRGTWFDACLEWQDDILKSSATKT